MKIVVVVGIRAQYIKLASLQRSVNKWNQDNATRVVDLISVNSGQHYDDDLAGRFIRELDVKFDHDLTEDLDDKEPTQLFANVFLQLTEVLSTITKVDWVVVFGDANTTLAAALAAARLKLRLVHVEAGVRVHNIFRVEEQNRVLTDHLSTVRFYSSKSDFENLIREGLEVHSYWSGDVIYDLVQDLQPSLSLSFLDWEPNRFVLATLHREENVTVDSILNSCVHALKQYGENVLFIVHPRTKQRLSQLDLSDADNIKFVDSLGYIEMLSAIHNCRFLFTDSGALQRESFYLGKRCVIRQDEPFWKSLVDLGVHTVVGKTKQAIVDGFEEMEEKLAEPYPVSEDLGTGNAGFRVISKLFELTHAGESFAP